MRGLGDDDGPSAAAEVRARCGVGESAASTRWLELEDGFELLAKAIGPPWDGPLESGGHQSAPEEWQRAPTEAGSSWEHEYLWCARAGGHVCVHRFVSPDRVATRLLCASLARLAGADAAAQQRSTPPRDDTRSASNIGGHHGSRDLWQHPSFQATGLPDLVEAAVRRAAALEGRSLGRAALALARDVEAWWNVLPRGAWNALHTHPGHEFACAYFVDDGGVAVSADGLGGRLVLLPAAPDQLTEDHRAHVLPAAPSSEVVAPAADGDDTRQPATPPTSASAADDGARLRYLLVDPVPGSCVVFPAFLPHFVAPLLPERPSASPAAPDPATAAERPSASPAAADSATATTAAEAPHWHGVVGDAQNGACAAARDATHSCQPCPHPRVSVAFNF